MPKNRFTDEQIAFALRQAEASTSVGEICRKMGVAEAMFYRWKKVYAGMGVAAQAARGGEFEAVAAGRRPDAGQDDAAGLPAKRVVKPVCRREVIRHCQEVFALSERRACRATGFGRASHRYVSRRDPAAEIRMRIKELAESRVSNGYRRLHVLL